MRYRFIFKDGHTEDSEAPSASEAFRRLGYRSKDILGKLRTYELIPPNSPDFEGEKITNEELDPTEPKCEICGKELFSDDRRGCYCYTCWEMEEKWL